MEFWAPEALLAPHKIRLYGLIQADDSLILALIQGNLQKQLE